MFDRRNIELDEAPFANDGKPPSYVLPFDELHLRMGLIETVQAAGLHRKKENV
jgi:hypothetical protein